MVTKIIAEYVIGNFQLLYKFQSAAVITSEDIEQIQLLDIYNSNLSRGVWENYKTHRDDRPLIRKEILWSVLRAALKSSPRVKSYDLLHICS